MAATLGEALFARWYPIVAGVSERAGQAETRARLVGQASGRTLEVGAGNGYDLPHYPAAVTELVVSEPSAHMLVPLRRQLRATPPPAGHWDVLRAGGERLPFADAAFDTVVAVYVLCTIPDPEAALDEIRRVLRPGGRYLFLEHVRAPEDSVLGHVQDLIATPHRHVAAGCRPNRRTGELIERSGLAVERMQRGRQPRSSPTVRPTILGTAVR